MWHLQSVPTLALGFALLLTACGAPSEPTPQPNYTLYPTYTPLPPYTSHPTPTDTPQLSEAEAKSRVRAFFEEEQDMKAKSLAEFVETLRAWRCDPITEINPNCRPEDVLAHNELVEDWFMTVSRARGRLSGQYEGHGTWLVTVSYVVYFRAGKEECEEQWWVFERGDEPPRQKR